MISHTAASRRSDAANCALARLRAAFLSELDRVSAMALPFGANEMGRRKTRRPFSSDSLQIGRLGAPRVGLDVERHLLPFVEAAQAGCFHGRDMDEHVLAAAFRGNEAETFGGIEEFNSTDGHLFPLDHRGSAYATRASGRGKREHQA